MTIQELNYQGSSYAIYQSSEQNVLIKIYEVE